ncbi:hypothetical protein JOF41_004378 [Saccharothrix coeruleofusca]|uniref:hypothetical protein n=1 Tax=Saccharothrix coeruleofusca TaxID=33919 RepID=UPI001AE7E973|nr:hypothetical protein [Saccharothrix coeruleofusca]MBP2338200.1 hypothetical protein [Saccharothrix coeruleofusca]
MLLGVASKAVPAVPALTDNTTVGDLRNLSAGNPLELIKSKRNLSDADPLDSVFNPQGNLKEYPGVTPDRTVLFQGNHRAAELMARAAGPDNLNINWGMPIYIRDF